MEKMLVFIPMYNCGKQVVRVLDQFDDEVKKYFTDIILVNNRSTDDSEKVVLKYKKKHKDLNIKVLRNDENYNLGGSHKVAFEYAIQNDYDYVVVLHGDDQGDIHDLLPVLKNEVYKEHDCMLGARFMKGSKLIGYSKFRTFGNKVYNLLFSIGVHKKIYDLGSGLNLYRVDMLKDNFYYQFPDSLSFNYCMILASHYYKHDIAFFPITWREDDQVSNVKMMNQAFNVLKMLFKYIFKHSYIKSDFRTKKIEQYSAKEIK